MRGEAATQAIMLTAAKPDALVPQSHPIRRIKPMVDSALAALSPTFCRMYSALGRPSIPPEHLLKGCLLMVLFSVRSERQSARCGGRRSFRGPGAGAAVRLDGAGWPHQAGLCGQPPDRRFARSSRTHDVNSGGTRRTVVPGHEPCGGPAGEIQRASTGQHRATQPGVRGARTGRRVHRVGAQARESPGRYPHIDAGAQCASPTKIGTQSLMLNSA